MARFTPLSVQETHYPTDTEESRHETAKTIDTILNALPVGTLSNQAEHDTREQRKQNGNFKMIEVDFHRGDWLFLLFTRNLIRINHGENVQ
jgi:hypothetical protein